MVLLHRRRNLVATSELLWYQARRRDLVANLILALLAEIPRSHYDAFAWRQLQANALVKGPGNDFHRQGSAGVTLQGARVEPLTLLGPSERPDVDVLGVLGVPLLVGHHKGVLGRDPDVPHTTSSSPNIWSHLFALKGLLVPICSVVDPDTLIAHRCQQGAICAPGMPECICRRGQRSNHLHAKAVSAFPFGPAPLFSGLFEGGRIVDDDALLGRREELHAPRGHVAKRPHAARPPTASATRPPALRSTGAGA
mmetsp:Transcript_15243/g.32011  ORF Transcript_15243/g.32011 Transcript_15243/m.32011 type:complete len:253 (-) Transcript_15243:7-765(-)